MYKDITGQRFDRLTVVKYSHRDEVKRVAVWECMCDCGKTVIAKGVHLRNGSVRSCGCLRLDALASKPAHNFDDLTGQKFHRLTVLNRVPNERGYNTTRWLCRCDCGTEKVVDRTNLASGKIRSCGCFNSERRAERQLTHGLSKTKLYKVWSWMLTRCYNEKCEHYKDYGGRGIGVSDEWRSDFLNFYNDMAPGYKPGLELDRIEVNGDYSKGNCRWATDKQNARNKRNTTYLTIDGVTKPLGDWAEISGRWYQNIHRSLRQGKSHKESVFGKPKNHKSPNP
jgi:hypothetical protein